MATREGYLTQPLPDRLRRLAQTPDELAAALNGQDDAALSQRRSPSAWAPKEVICHFRDIEELCVLRFHTMLATDDPEVFVVGAPPSDPERWGIGGDVPFPLDPDRWVEDRQYARNDTAIALIAFRRRRTETLALLNTLSPQQWRRGSIHPTHGRVSFAYWTAGMAAHDDNHLAQLRLALPPHG